MCGIGGIYSYRADRLPQEHFVPFIDSIAHRGPDGRGTFEDAKENLWLGHRRLKILDLSPTGAQPMSYANGRFTITFNGEIYNFLELRRELVSLGYSFQSETDTEVILAAYAHWGDACQFKFNGMWAFAIWDAKEKILFLSRDRFGVKPLHYYCDDRTMAFASEMKAFLFLPGAEISVDPEAVAFTLQHTNCLEATQRTLLQGVNRLQAGCSATFSKQGGFQIKQWWNTLAHLRIVPASFSDQVDEFRSLFEDACRIRMRSDVPLGSALSGGLDSSSVLAMMAHIGHGSNGQERRSPEWQSVFTAVYPGSAQQDELAFAQQMVQHTQTRSYLCPIDAATLVENLEDALYQLEEIFELPMGPWMLYREFRKKGVVISVDGHGGDELLGGYHHYVEVLLSQALFPGCSISQSKRWMQLLRSMYCPDTPLVPSSFHELLYRSTRERLRMTPLFETVFRKIHGWVKSAIRPKESHSWIQIPYPTISPVFQAPAGLDRLPLIDRMLYRDFHHFSLPTILRNFDRCSMAHGVEIRAPFLDWRLVAFCFSLPTVSKINPQMTKRILRESMKGLMPESIRLRMTKIGFTNPMIEWFRGNLKPYILDSIRSQSFNQSSIWDGPRIRTYVEDCFRRNDIAEARKCWEFVQADRLIALFQAKKLSQ
jgi:asparagine synthase (glutamine-hydrolysing)